MSCEPHDFVFGASNLSYHESTVLHVRGLDPNDDDDRRELCALACDVQVRTLMESRRLKFARPSGFRLARAHERVALHDEQLNPPFSLLGSVRSERIDALFAKYRPAKSECMPEPVESEHIPLLPERPGFLEVELEPIWRFELPHGHAQQMVLRLVPAADAPDQDCFVARIDHYSEGDEKRRLSRSALKGSQRYGNAAQVGAHYLGGMIALFVLPYNPF